MMVKAGITAADVEVLRIRVKTNGRGNLHQPALPFRRMHVRFPDFVVNLLVQTC